MTKAEMIMEKAAVSNKFVAKAMAVSHLRTLDKLPKLSNDKLEALLSHRTEVAGNVRKLLGRERAGVVDKLRHEIVFPYHRTRDKEIASKIQSLTSYEELMKRKGLIR
jgi:hypothetical protein